MNNRAPPEKREYPVYNGGYPESSYPSSRPSTAAFNHTDPRAPTTFHRYESDSQGFGFPPSSFHVAPPFAFDPSVPLQPHFRPPAPNIPPPAPVNSYGSFNAPTFQTFNPYYGPGPLREQQPAAGSHPEHLDQRDWNQRRREDAAAEQKKQDERWLQRFLQNRDRLSRSPQQTPQTSGPGYRDQLCLAAQLVSSLSESCESLKTNLDNQCAWTDSYLKALRVKTELQDKLAFLSDSEAVRCFRAKLARNNKRRVRRLRGRNVTRMEAEQRETRIAEKEADIDKWRMKLIHQEEEKKKERELTLAADSVLCEVRKKQADIKRMQEVFRSLEKLRKLRKEAALRKGILTEQQSEETFNSQLEKMRSVMRKRTATYSAEEKALMVMLEGAQEEERRRDMEKKLKNERDRRLQMKHKVDSMLFGDETPADPDLQPFREYYTQAQRTLHALVQIRRDWDVFLVAAYHPDGTSVPQDWVLPDPPADQVWASALLSCDGP